MGRLKGVGGRRGAGRPPTRRDEVIQATSHISNAILDPIRNDFDFSEWTDEEVAALKAYLSLNKHDRSKLRLASVTGIPERTCQKWMEKFRFPHIAKLFDARTSIGPLEETEIGLHEVLAQRVRLHKITAKAVRMFESALDKGEIKLKVEDFVKVAKLQMELLGLTGDLTPKEEGMSDEELRAAIIELGGKVDKHDRIVIERFAEDDARRIAEEVQDAEDFGAETPNESSEPVYSERHSA